MNLAAFQQSAFLQSLGWAIANSIWQGGMLWIFYQIIVSSYSNASSKFKNNLSTVLLFGNFLWFMITFFTKIIHLRNYLPGSTANQLLYYTNADPEPGYTNFQNFISSIVITLPYLSLAYLLLLLIFAIKLVNSYRNTSFIKNNGLQRPAAEWRVFVEKVANHIGIGKKIKIWFSKHVDVPATIGFLKPVILIPLASLNQLTPDQMEAIILHEISHIKRNDYLVNLFISLIETILFFNPFVVLLGKIIKKERENCCDDFVLQYQYDRHSYASALLVLEQSREQQFYLALAATSGRKQLLFRIKRIMEVKNSNDGLNYGQKLLTLLLSTGIICSIAWLTPEKKVTAHSDKQVPGKVSLDVQPDKRIQLKDSSLHLKYEEPKKVISFIKNLKEQQNDITVIPETAADMENNDEVTPLIENERNADEISAKDEHHNRVFELKNPALLNSLNAVNNILFSTNSSFSSNLNFFEDLYLNIDLNKLKADIEKQNQAISTIDWKNVQEQFKINFEKNKMPEFKINIKNNRVDFAPGVRELKENDRHDKMNFAPGVKEFKKNSQDEFKFRVFNKFNEARNRATRNMRDDDSLNFSSDTDDDDNDDNNDDNGGISFSYEGPEENNVAVLLPPQQVLRRKKAVAVCTPAFPPPVEYAYTIKSHNSPKVKLPPTRPVHIEYKEGSIVINGEKIDLSNIKRSQAEKIIKKVIEKNNKHVIEIVSTD